MKPNPNTVSSSIITRNVADITGGNANNTHEAVVQSSAGPILKDTIIYCQADKYGLQELKKLALKKQGLQSGIQCSTILTSARYAYANTPDNDSKLRAPNRRLG
jgi:hypothetical protein